MFKSTEADDIIAYLSNMKELEGAEKLIISSDKDFYQLLDSKTVLYRPIQKEVLKTCRLEDEYIKTNTYPQAKELARKITGIVNAWPNLNLIKSFYLAVNEKFHPHYSKIIRDIQNA